MNLAKTFAYGHIIFFPILSHPAAAIWRHLLPVIPVDMAGGQAESNIKKNGRQPLILKDQGEVLRVHASVFKLTIWREAASVHREAASCSEKPMSTSNTTISQAFFIQKSSEPRTGTSLPSNKQRPWRQESESLSLPLLSCHNTDLIEAL